MITPPEQLYTVLFDRLGIPFENADDEDTNHMSFLLENHLHYTEVDRGLDIQYDFCVLWLLLIQELWIYRKNKTESLPFPLCFPLRGNHVTDSYFIYVHEQIRYLLQINIHNIIQVLFRDQTETIDRSSTSLDTLLELQLKTTGTIHVYAVFEREYMIKYKVLPIPTIDLHSNELKIYYQMIRVLLLWMSVCTILQELLSYKKSIRNEMEQHAMDRLDTLVHIIDHLILPALLTLPEDLFGSHRIRMKAIKKSALIESLLVRAERQTSLKNYILAASCYDVARTSFDWIESSTAKQLQQSLFLEDSDAKLVHPDNSQIHTAEPVGRIDLGLFAVCEFRKDRSHLSFIKPTSKPKKKTKKKNNNSQ